MPLLSVPEVAVAFVSLFGPAWNWKQVHMERCLEGRDSAWPFKAAIGFSASASVRSTFPPTKSVALEQPLIGAYQGKAPQKQQQLRPAGGGLTGIGAGVAGPAARPGLRGFDPFGLGGDDVEVDDPREVAAGGLGRGEKVWGGGAGAIVAGGCGSATVSMRVSFKSGEAETREGSLGEEV
jgi:hypothetical protein